MLWSKDTRRMLVAAFVTLAIAGIINGEFLAFSHIWPSSYLPVYYSWALQFSDSLNQGYMYPRWMPNANLGLGEPAFLYYPPMFFYSVALANVLLDNIWASLKLVITLATWAVGLISFMIFRRHLPHPRALLGAMCIQAAPFMFFILNYFDNLPWYSGLPFSLLVLHFTLHPPKSCRYLNYPLILSMASLVMTHILSGFMVVVTFPFLFFPSFLKEGIGSGIRALMKWATSIAIALILAMIYLLPALRNLHLVNPQAWWQPLLLDWRNSFAFPAISARIWGIYWFSPQWIVAGSIFFSTLTVTTRLMWNRSAPSQFHYLLFSLICVAWAALFLASELSFPIWAWSDFVRKVQYPIRFLYIASFVSIVALALDLWHSKTVKGQSLSPFLPVAALIVSVGLTCLMVIQIQLSGKIIRLSPKEAEGRLGVPEYLPIGSTKAGWVSYVSNGGLEAQCAQLSSICKSTMSRSQEREWDIKCTRPVALTLPLLAFPAWSISIDDRKTDMTADAGTGLIRVALASGSHRVHLRWTGLPEERTGLWISIATAFLLLLSIFLPVSGSRWSFKGAFEAIGR